MVDRIRHILENTTLTWWGAIAPGEDTTCLIRLTFAHHLKQSGLFNPRVPLSTRVANFTLASNAHTAALFDDLPSIIKTLNQFHFYNIQPGSWRNYETSGLIITNDTVSQPSSPPFEWTFTYDHPPIFDNSTKLKDIVW